MTPVNRYLPARRYLVEWCVSDWGPDGEEPIYKSTFCGTLVQAQEHGAASITRHGIPWARIAEHKRSRHGWRETQVWRTEDGLRWQEDDDVPF